MHTLARFWTTPTLIRTLWRFGRNRRRVRACEWLKLPPATGPFPQIAQRRAIAHLSGSSAVVRSLNDGRILAQAR